MCFRWPFIPLRRATRCKEMKDQLVLFQQVACGGNCISPRQDAGRWHAVYAFSQVGLPLSWPRKSFRRRRATVSLCETKRSSPVDLHWITCCCYIHDMYVRSIFIPRTISSSAPALYTPTFPILNTESRLNVVSQKSAVDVHWVLCWYQYAGGWHWWGSMYLWSVITP